MWTISARPAILVMADGRFAWTNMVNSEDPQDQIIEPVVLEVAKVHVFDAKPVSEFPCQVCGTQGATERSDGLCWVCRRLKISAWREGETRDSDGD